MSQNKDGGFGILPPANMRKPDLYATYFNLSSLAELSSLELVKQVSETAFWLKSLIKNLSVSENNEISINDLYYIVNSLKILNTEVLNKEDIISFIKKHQCSNGAYRNTYSISKNVIFETENLIFSTYHAVSILNLLNEPIDMYTQNWLTSMWNKRDGINIVAMYQLADSLKIAGKNVNTSNNDIIFAKEIIHSPKSLAEVKSSLFFLDNDSVEVNELYLILNDLQQQNGGYSFDIPSYIDDPQGTFLALNIYNQIKQAPPNKDKILNMIVHNQSHLGGFFNNWHCDSLGITTYYTVAILKMMGFQTPSNVDKYVVNQLKDEKRPNYIYPLIMLSEIEGIKVNLDTSCVSNLKDIVNNNKIKNAEELRDLFFSIYILKYLNYDFSDEEILMIKNKINDIKIITENFKIEKYGLLPIYYASKIVRTLNIETDILEKSYLHIKVNQSENGCFSINGYTDMVINYLIIDTFNDVGYNMPYDQNLVNWIKQSKSNYCGFQMKPGEEDENDPDTLLSTYAALYIFKILE